MLPKFKKHLTHDISYQHTYIYIYNMNTISKIHPLATSSHVPQRTQLAFGQSWFHFLIESLQALDSPEDSSIEHYLVLKYGTKDRGSREMCRQKLAKHHSYHRKQLEWVCHSYLKALDDLKWNTFTRVSFLFHPKIKCPSKALECKVHRWCCISRSRTSLWWAHQATKYQSSCRWRPVGWRLKIPASFATQLLQSVL